MHGWFSGITVKGNSSVTVQNLITGDYTVTEDRDDAEIDGYKSEVAISDKGEVKVTESGTAKVTATNSNEEMPPAIAYGEFTVSKTLMDVNGETKSRASVLTSS